MTGERLLWDPVPFSIPAPAEGDDGPHGAHQQPTTEEALAFAESLEQQLMAEQRPDMDSFVDHKSILIRASKIRAMSSFDISAALKVWQSNGLLRNYPEFAVADIRFLRLHVVDGEQRALFRAEGDDGIGYFDFVLAKFDGTIKIVDFAHSGVGTLHSVLFEDVTRRMRGASKRELALVKKFQQLMLEEKSAGAIAVYKGLPKELREAKVLMSYYIVVTFKEEGEDYTEAVQQWREFFPDNISTDLLSIDYFYVQNDLDAALEAIDRVDARVDDFFLDAYRSHTLFLKGDLKQAETLARKTWMADQSMDTAFWTLYYSLLEQKDYDSLVNEFKIYEQLPQYELPNWEDMLGAEEFLQSRAYKKWMAERQNQQ